MENIKNQFLITFNQICKNCSDISPEQAIYLDQLLNKLTYLAIDLNNLNKKS